MSQYIPDLTERFPEGFGGVDLTDSYILFDKPRCETSETFAEEAKKILEKHRCKFIKMESECMVVWENCIGIVRIDDIAVLRNITDKAWNYWCNN